MPFEEFAYEIMKSVQEQFDKVDVRQERVEKLQVYQRLKEKLMLQMVPVGGNEEMLSRVPHRQMDDLAIVYREEKLFESGIAYEERKEII